jgi:hypothetical protein
MQYTVSPCCLVYSSPISLPPSPTTAHIHTRTHTYIHTYIHTRTNTHTRTHTHTRAHLPQPTSQGTDHSAVQCFSHWTHHITGGRMMVVDCQGCWTGAGGTTAGTDSGTGGSGSAGAGAASVTTPDTPTPPCFLLTDPAVHCTSLLLFGSTNMGHGGFDRFFRTHKCNQHCAALRLPESPLQRQTQQAQVPSLSP